jgi:hypothetical protein
MAELANNYAVMDFDKLNRDGERFATTVGTLNRLYTPKGKKIKVKY